MASVVASVRDDSIIGRKRGRFLRLWPLSLSAGAVSCAVCRRRYSAGWGALQREEFSTSDNRSAALVVHRNRRQLAYHRNKRSRPRGYNNLANAYSKEGKINQAIETAKMAIQLQPNSGIAHFNLGTLYAARGRFDLAQPHFEETIRLYPNYAEAHSNFGQLLLSGATSKAASGSFVRPLN
jgi:tetratricopeptide (TPR) repeat protein